MIIRQTRTIIHVNIEPLSNDSAERKIEAGAFEYARTSSDVIDPTKENGVEHLVEHLLSHVQFKHTFAKTNTHNIYPL